ncbi:reverse transcriptase domain-containing protein [Tanacetum coccineum]|uniref:Reverse transcriptase domain-containing protein n=1 Tax=Tanacetum coccineum TaxID=301880 RepID=A0ABQ5F4X7_9ASTR
MYPNRGGNLSNLLRVNHLCIKIQPLMILMILWNVSYDTLDYMELRYVSIKISGGGQACCSVRSRKESANKDSHVLTRSVLSTDKQNEGTDKKNDGTDKQDGGTDSTKVSTDRQGEGTTDQDEGKSVTQTPTSTPTPITPTSTTSLVNDEPIAQACTDQVATPALRYDRSLLQDREIHALWVGTASGLRPYHFTYPERKLTMEEMLYKFINEGKREHEEMRAFICDFQTTNKILFKERNNSLIELRFRVQELLKVINNTPMIDCEVKGVTTRGGKTTTQDAHNNDDSVHTEETHTINQDKPVESDEVLIKEGKRRGLAEEVLRKPEAAPHKSAFHRGPNPNAKLPSKEKDLGSFTIPCDIGQLHINNALADLGASISLMPYTMYEKLGLGEPKATRVSLELADRSIQYPRGIIENVLIKVNKFVLPIDFVILDMPEDSRVPIILGRPCLATARAMIDVFNKKITLRVGDDEVIFDVINQKTAH